MSNQEISSCEDGTIFHENAPIEGTSARTRPFSLEEYLLRRKNRLTGSNLKDRSNDFNSTRERKDPNKTSDLADMLDNYENDVEDTKNRTKKEVVPYEEEHLRHKGKNKTGQELEVNAAVKSFDFIAKHQSRDNNESSSHHQGRMKDKFKITSEKEVMKKHAKVAIEGDKQDNRYKVEEPYKNESERGTSRKRSKHATKDSAYDKSRKDERLKSGLEKDSTKKRSKPNDLKDKNEHRGRIKDLFKDGLGKDNTNKRFKDVSSKEKVDRRIRDDDRYKGTYEFDNVKQRSKSAAVKDRGIQRDRSPSRDDRRSYHGRDAKFKPDFERSSLRRYNSYRVDYEHYSDRKYRRYEETTKRRSRSRSPDHAREPSVSISPRNRRYHHHGKDYADTSSLNSQEHSSRKHLEVEKYKTSGNAGYEGGHHQQRSSGLGGYSPRKRKTEAMPESPSPIIHSPERKTTVDQQSADSTVNSQLTVAGIPDRPSSITATSTFKNTQATLSPNGATVILDTSLDHVQLTQATRPKRRLYVENLPTSVSDKDVIEWLNGALLSSGTNHIPGSSPCISCIINKERSQAVVEFLTPEDATAVLAFDGRSFSGSTLKIRRPKDFTESTNVLLEKPVAGKQTVVTEACHSVSDIVENSSNKIFVGGISTLLSAGMFMEIAKAFGVLKSFHLETNEFEETCAFLQYLDPSITHKACCGLNGMKLGGHILTAVLAFPDYHLKQETELAPAHTVPDHAKPLLQNPTKVLKLKYVFNPEDFVLLSEFELEETVEDVRLECSRFGTVKSINIVKDTCCSAGDPSKQNFKIVSEEIVNENEASETEPMECQHETPRIPASSEIASAGNNKQEDAVLFRSQYDDGNQGEPDFGVPEASLPEFSYTHTGEEAGLEHEGSLELSEENAKPETEGLLDLQKTGMVKSEPSIDDVTVHQTLSDRNPEKVLNGEEQSLGDDINKVMNNQKQRDTEQEGHNGLMEADIGDENSEQIRDVNCNEQPMLDEQIDPVETKQQYDYDNEVIDRRSTPEHMNEAGERLIYNSEVFEVGCVLVEFLREEAACTAAHCLHGRLYDDRTIETSYVAHSCYLARFLR